jgi:hypothetical protein
MELTDAARFFNDTVFTDAYGSATFKGKMMAYPDSMRDSLATVRRILQVAPAVAIPARRVIVGEGATWLVGDNEMDFYKGAELRNKFIVHKAGELANFYTFADALNNTPTKQLWAGRLWVKNSKELEQGAGEFGDYQVFVAKGEELRNPNYADNTYFEGREWQNLIHIEGRWNLIRVVNNTIGGFQSAVVDELPEPVVVNVGFTVRGKYNPVTDSYPETTVSVSAIHLRWQTNFQYLAQYAVKFVVGDCIVKILKTAASPVAGSLATIYGRQYKVVSVADEAPCWAVHLTRV